MRRGVGPTGTRSGPGTLPRPIAATALDLPARVGRALAHPPPPTEMTVDAAGIPFAVRSWGQPTDPPTLLVHGVTASSGIWWRTGAALAAAGRHVLAPDLPGHGRTGHWRGRHRFTETAQDVAALVDGLGLRRPDLDVIGHSWGAMIVAALPVVGVRPRTLVQLDPPVLPLARMAAMAVDPVEHAYDDLDEAVRAIGTANPTWSFGDVVHKATALSQLDESAARAVLLENGDWDGGLAALVHPAAAEVSCWLVRGETGSGSFTANDALPAFAARSGWEHILTVAGGPHSPQRTHPEATLVAFLRAVGGG